MGSNQEAVNRRIRETISVLSGEDLREMLNASARNYTPFARQVAEEELSRRRRSDESQKNISSVPDADKRAACCVEIWSDKNFDGEYLRVEGPVEYPALHFTALDWGNSVSSLRVGPSAFLLVYADEDFKGAMMSFGPGQEVADLEEMRFNDEIDSIRLVNSLKVFDELRRDDSKIEPQGPLPKKEPPKRRRRRND